MSTGCAHHTRTKIPQSARATPSPTSAPAPTAAPPAAKIGSTETGIASWYGNPYHGRRAASGEIYDMEQLTAAHRTLPFQTWVEVTDLDNGKKVTVRITDRGPFVDGRIIDLSLAAAREIEMVGPGVARVKLKVVPAPKAAPVVDLTTRDSGSTPAQVAKRDTQTSPPPVGANTHALPDPALLRPETNNVTLPKNEPGSSTSSKFGPSHSASPPIPQLYTVQVAAFADRDRAEAYSDTLRNQFADLINESRVVAAPSVWKVLLGRQLSLDAANDLAAKLKDTGATALVIRDF